MKGAKLDMWSNRHTGPGALRLDIYTEAVVSTKEALRTDDLLHKPYNVLSNLDVVMNVNMIFNTVILDYCLASLNTHVACFNFIHDWPNLQFNVDCERQIFEKFFHGNFNLLAEFLPEIC